MASIMNKQMMYVMPLVTVFIGFSFPVGSRCIGSMSLLQVAQQAIF